MTISSVSAVDQSTQAPKPPAPKSAPATPPAQKPDSVHLSAAALAASKDTDHDGDSK